jgi:hypothetical protein
MLRESRPRAQTASNKPAQTAIPRMSTLRLEALHLADSAETAASARPRTPDADTRSIRIDPHRIDALGGQMLPGKTAFVEVAVFPRPVAAHLRRHLAQSVGVFFAVGVHAVAALVSASGLLGFLFV